MTATVVAPAASRSGPPSGWPPEPPRGGRPGRPPLELRPALASFAAGLLAAILLPDNPTGLGVVVTALAMATAVESARPRPLTAWPVALNSAALVLAGTALHSDADWVLSLCLLAACGLASLSLAGGITLGETIRGLFVAATHVLPAPRALLRPLWARLRGTSLSAGAPALRAVLIALALAVPFLLLFMTADRAFAEIARRYLLPNVDLGSLPVRFLVLAIVASFCGALVLTAAAVARARAPRAPSSDDVGDDAAGAPAGRALSRLEWVTALIALDLVFLAFVLVQLTVLFGGRDHVLLTTGLSYAEYARSGFFQLLAVAGLTLVVVAGFALLVDHRERSERVRLQLLLGVLCSLTLVILVSSWRRLSLYVSEFGLTQLRVSVQATIIWLAIVFVMVMVAGAIWRGRWLPRAAVGLTAAALVVFALLKPDALIAHHNVALYERTGRIDAYHLSTLSADAVPALVRLPDHVRECVLRRHRERLGDDESWVSWNLSRQHARTLLAQTPAPRCDA